MLISPGGLHQDPSQMGVAGLGNRPSLDVVSAGMFPRHQSAVAHQLAWTLKTGQAAEFANDSRRSHLGYAAQRLQRFDHRADLRTGLRHGLIDGSLQLENLFGGVFDLMEV